MIFDSCMKSRTSVSDGKDRTVELVEETFSDKECIRSNKEGTKGEEGRYRLGTLGQTVFLYKEKPLLP